MNALVLQPSVLELRPRVARVYEHLLGGTEAYECDREVARELRAVAPWVRDAARINRAHLPFAVRTAVELGVRQVLDLGCGLPHTVGNVHEITGDLVPASRVVYVDHDPDTWPQARTQLDDGPPHYATPLQADVLAMGRLLDQVAELDQVDLAEPTAVIAHDVLPWNGDDDAVWAAMAALRERLPVGSVLSITHASSGRWHPSTMPRVVEVYERHGIVFRPRARQEIADLFGTWIHLGPGLTATARWHADHPWSARHPRLSAAYAGIAIKARP
ncbi:SAM-dependent methyltransferase [Streptomyces sp. NPDC047315]|uniref:SAM-dependent methyltransferase n=1 Tax=Streptomyces sp. NPDC047315 TaxID=3155142 RepID=UPI0033E5A991